MAEKLFSFDKANAHDCQNLFRGEREQEYYRGDFWVEDATTIEVRSERKAVGPISMIVIGAIIVTYVWRLLTWRPAA